MESYKDFFNQEYYESGPQSGKSLYQNYRWIPELTIPLAHQIIKYCDIKEFQSVMDFGCAKGYLVYALRLLGIECFGVDISRYAISQAPKEVSSYIDLIEPLSDDFRYTEFLLCKDILEHIPYENIDKQMDVLYNSCDKIFAIIPLGENGKYIIPAYELDKSHFIRENQQWWSDKFEQVGFKVETTTDLGPFKVNWQDVNSKGNLLIMGEKL